MKRCDYKTDWYCTWDTMLRQHDYNNQFKKIYLIIQRVNLLQSGNSLR